MENGYHKSGEAFKVQATVDSVIGQLIEMGADRTYTLVGVGGGVVTDLAGYIASVYMRGINFRLCAHNTACRGRRVYRRQKWN
jgi:3-dehydroquinate synthetase